MLSTIISLLYDFAISLSLLTIPFYLIHLWLQYDVRRYFLQRQIKYVPFDDDDHRWWWRWLWCPWRWWSLFSCARPRFACPIRKEQKLHELIKREGTIWGYYQHNSWWNMLFGVNDRNANAGPKSGPKSGPNDDDDDEGDGGGGATHVVIAQPALVYAVMVKQFHCFTDRKKSGLNNRLIDQMLWYAQNNVEWKHLRAIVGQIFATANCMSHLKQGIQQTAQQLVYNIEQSFVPSSSTSSTNAMTTTTEVVTVQDFRLLSSSFALDTILCLVFGAQCNSWIEMEEYGEIGTEIGTSTGTSATQSSADIMVRNARALFGGDPQARSFGEFLLEKFAPQFVRRMKYCIDEQNSDECRYFRTLIETIVRKKREQMYCCGMVRGGGGGGKQRPQQQQQQQQQQQSDNFECGTNFIEMLLEVEEAQNRLISCTTNTTDANECIKYMSNDEIISQCIQFFMIGYDTIVTSISMIMYHLALYPGIQQQLYVEIVTLIRDLDGGGSVNGNISSSTSSLLQQISKLLTLETIDERLPMLNAIVMETLRLYPPITLVERVAKRDCKLVIDTTGDDRRDRRQHSQQSYNHHQCLEIKRGDIIEIPIYSLHRNMEHYGNNVEQFDPYRFLPKNNNNDIIIDGDGYQNRPSPPHPPHLPSPPLFQPFGAGPRSCVAQQLALLEIKIATLYLIYHYRVSPCKGKTLIPMQFFTKSEILLPKNVLLNVERR